MNGQQHLIAASSPEWMEWLEGAPHDFYHTSAYHAFSQAQGEGEAWMAVSGDRDRFVAWPYLLRPVGTVEGLETSRARDITSIYGYGGPLLRGCCPADAFAGKSLERIEEIWESQKVVSAFSRLHPLLKNEALFASGSGQVQPSVVEMSPTISVDLQASDEAAWDAYHRTTRQEIRCGKAAGLRTVLDSGWEYFPQFFDLYNETMRRNNAAGVYFFSRDYLLGLKKALGAHATIAVTLMGGEVAAACIVIEYGGFIAGHLEGTATKFLPFSPFKVLVEDTRKWGAERGNAALHLGGGRGGQQDSLFAFKSRFSKRRHPFWIYRKIVDSNTYESLCGSRGALARDSARTFEPGDFFPAYRAPLGAAIQPPQPVDGFEKQRLPDFNPPSGMAVPAAMNV